MAIVGHTLIVMRFLRGEMIRLSASLAVDNSNLKDLAPFYQKRKTPTNLVISISNQKT